MAKKKPKYKIVGAQPTRRGDQTIADPLGLGFGSGPPRPANGYRPLPPQLTPSAEIYGTTPTPVMSMPTVNIPAQVSGTTGQQILNMPVGLRQQFLRSRGYDVAVDGILGPQTKTATNAFLKGTPAGTWNRAWQAAHTPAPAAPAPTPVATPAPQPAAPNTAAFSAPPAARTPQATPPPRTNPLNTLLAQYLNTLNSYKAPTLAQQEASAQRIAQAYLAPQLEANRQAQAQALADARRDATFQANLSAALANVLKGAGPATEATYRRATADTSALASGFSDAFRQSLAGAAGGTNAFLQSIGAPEGQMVDAGNAQKGADVLYGLGGLIPGAALAREGAAFTSAARQLPQTAVGRGQQLAADALRAGSDERAQLRGDLQTILAGQPKLVQDALAQIQEQESKNYANAQNQALIPFVLADKFEDLPGINPITGRPTKPTRDARADAARAQAKTKADKAKADQKAAPRYSATNSRTLGYRADQYGNPIGGRIVLTPGFTIDNKGQIVKSTRKTTTRAKKLTVAQKQRYTSSIAAMVRNLKDGFEDADGKEHPPVGYNQAISELTAAGYFSSQPLRALALEALYSTYGRPEQVTAAEWAAEQGLTGK